VVTVRIFYVIVTKLAGNSTNVILNDTGTLNVVNLYVKSICGSWRIQNAYGNSVYSGTGYTFPFLFNIDHIIEMFQIIFYDINED
jgi:hypothetical protein